MTGPKMIPEFIAGVVKENRVDTTYRCIDCLLGGLETVLDTVYVVSGTVLCKTHAVQTRMREMTP